MSAVRTHDLSYHTVESRQQIDNAINRQFPEKQAFFHQGNFHHEESVDLPAQGDHVRTLRVLFGNDHSTMTSDVSVRVFPNVFAQWQPWSIRRERGNQRLKWGYLIVLPYFIAATVVGALHWDDCPIQPQIPMLVTG